ncbi:signal transduction histidine kinase [Kibdelosporangium banguiense]|uniref:histidine kinase n=1 Tax=Kibdelosporangium banguiense TaxID=1365924 RepID=A0ABS4TQE4_9PSEU|nr:histidine kinase [Kibdelosporangium banguiense]MBP2326632.1 signal transduction histidine kinase [Kibdelosporangium banguiense]
MITRDRVVDALLVGLAGFDAWLTADVFTDGTDLLVIAFTVIAALGLVVRRSLPWVSFLVTLPTWFVSQSMVATLVALYTAARLTRDRRVLALAGLVVACGYAFPWPPQEFSETPGKALLLSVVYAVMTAAAPVFLGQLVRARHLLSLRLKEIDEAREHERELIAQTVLAKERAQLAREMHDVVSHQVSLIAVRAGALQVSTADADAKDAASTIRRLSADTLDELRHMVTLLRASGSLDTELSPQPTLAQLEQLIRSSGIHVRLDGELPTGIGAHSQRAIYRTVQEALTNVRKHAPGATATVHIEREDTDLTVTITNTRPTRPAVQLPSAHHGLIGLRERAELLGGTVEAGPIPGGGFRVRLALSTAGQ